MLLLHLRDWILFVLLYLTVHPSVSIDALLLLTHSTLFGFSSVAHLHVLVTYAVRSRFVLLRLLLLARRFVLLELTLLLLSISVLNTASGIFSLCWVLNRRSPSCHYSLHGWTLFVYSYLFDGSFFSTHFFSD